MITIVKQKCERFWLQTYMRGRAAYTGDRTLPNAPTYLYEGYPGANVGDELIYNTVSGLLSPSQAVFCGRFRPPWEAMRCLLGKSKPRAVIFGGGTISPTHVPRDPRFRKGKLPLFAFGLGDITASLKYDRDFAVNTRETWKHFVERVDVQMFGVRGPRSLQWFREIIPDPIITGDTALAAFDIIGQRESEFIGLNFGRHFGELTTSQLNMYADIIVAIGSLGMPVLLIPLHSSDLMCIRAVLNLPRRTWPKQLRVIEYVPSVLQFTRLLSKMAFGVGERLHFSIPLFASGIPSIMLAYADKHYDFAESVHAEKSVVGVEEMSADVVMNMANSVIKGGCVIGKDTLQAISRLKGNLLQRFQLAREFIEHQVVCA